MAETVARAAGTGSVVVGVAQRPGTVPACADGLDVQRRGAKLCAAVVDGAGHQDATVRYASIAPKVMTHTGMVMGGLAGLVTAGQMAQAYETRSEVTEARGAFYYRVSLPAHNYEIVELESQTLFPAALPDCRLVILNWIQRDDSDGDTGSATRPAVEEARSQPSASPLPGQVTAGTADEAAKYAGPGAVPLPILSELIGTGCQLTYSPTNRTVIWATPQHDGRWDVAEVNPYTVVVRMPQAIHVEGATAEYKLLTTSPAIDMRACWPGELVGGCSVGEVVGEYQL
ncbi:hypothetical protein ACFYU2_44255, partial [Streptomyces sp. NPDC004296]